ncbi:unnamed protein product [Pleuronectes platessa]|uniref:G-patch domain-containing protein n=1 Tax=Pleuronectes platessa TaxID=8262 RepID=A0A9N7V247_PLEPL|nr:unnamed protein product [Pleuronectes platessa]
MAANIEQIFQDFILSKIREIEDQNEEKPAGDRAAPCSEAEAAEKATTDREKQDDFRASGSQKKHKKHKKHKSKKKKRNRQKESSSESVAEPEGTKQSRRGTLTEVNKEQGEEKKSKSKCHKRHSTGKHKKKKRKKKGEDNSSGSDSEYVSKQRDSNCDQRLSPRRREELPDIIPKQDSSNKGRRDEERRERRSCRSRSCSQSHSDNHSHSCSARIPSRSRCDHHHRRSRTRSLSSSKLHRTRSSSSEKRKALNEPTQSPPLASSPCTGNITTEGLGESSTAELLSPDQCEKPAEKKETTQILGCGSSQSSLDQSTVTKPDPTTEPGFPQLKAAECPRYLATDDKSKAKKKRKTSKSPPRSKEGKSSKRQKRSKSPCRSHRKRSRSRSPSRRTRSRSRSGGRRSRRSRSWSASRSRKRTTYSQRDRWKREPSHSPVLILRKDRSSPTRKHGSPGNSPQRISELDKEQLLEIAKANAAAMCAKAGMPVPASLRSTVLPMALPNIAMNAAMASMTAATMTAAFPPPTAAQPNITALEEVKRKVAKQANSISIKEFTDKCKMIVDSKGELPVAVPHVSDEEDDGKPFGGAALREQKAISFSINNTTVRPAVRSDAGIAKEFPVSSGCQHRKKEGEAMGAYGEWVPVDKAAEKAAAAARKASSTVHTATSSSGETAAAGSPEAGEQPAPGPVNDNVFPDPVMQPVDISQAVTERIKAQRRLAENPYDVNAICMLSRAQEQVDAWAQSNTVPGLFTGSTGAQVLSSEELSTGGPQAWLKKDQFLRAAPVSGGVGEFLMRKMGWRTGEGLGRNREGTVEPIIIDFKIDRKDLNKLFPV